MLSVLLSSHSIQRTYTTLTGWSFIGDEVFCVAWELNLLLQGISCVYTLTVRYVQDQQPKGNVNLHASHIGFIS